ncbi:MAG TPA: LysR family transcriptional regulator [Burkholderiales bacterium]|nr:LysR family transcriptional regulator [Burkholderiales bacterium]
MNVTLEQWKALISIVESGGYEKAAEAIGKSQSSVTYAVQKLQSQLGVKAFEVKGRKAVLTPTGEFLYRRARALVDEAEAAERAAKKLSAGWEAEIGLAVDVAFPVWLLLECLQRFGAESPHTRIELVESVLGGSSEALLKGQVQMAITGIMPPGFLGELLMPIRFVAVAHPEHPLHKLGRPLTMQDLRAHRQLVVRESDTRRATRPRLEAAQRWTVTHMTTSIGAASRGYGYGWYPEYRIRDEIAAGTLKPLPMREGGENFAQLYLVFADRDAAGPGTLRLAAIIRELAEAACVEERKRQ